MKLTSTSLLLTLSVISLFYSSVALSQSASSTGDLTQIQTSSSSTISLNILQLGMDAAFKNAANYQQEHHVCPPANTINQNYGQKNIVVYIANDSQGAIVAQFSNSSAPGTLKGKYVRLVPKKHNNQCDYAAQLCVTTVDFGGQTFMLNPPRSFSYSSTLQGSNFGNCATASTNDTLNIGYTSLLNNSYNANKNVSYSSTGSQTSIG